jgi:hypothetical protein
MRSSITGGIVVTSLLLGASGALAQSTPAAPAAKPAARPSSSAATHQRNINEYVSLLRRDVRQEKSRVVGTAMELSQDEAAKFWPIYKEYDAQLTKLNDVRVGNITAFAQNYAKMTENKADEIVNGAISYHRKRLDLLANTYDKMRAALGAGKAARFLQVEDTLLNLIDLNIQSELPLMWGPPPPAQGAAKP